jgi:hypothetical protein
MRALFVLVGTLTLIGTVQAATAHAQRTPQKTAAQTVVLAVRGMT